MLPVRKLGCQGLTVSAIGLGCWGMTRRSYTIASEGDAIATLRQAIEVGINFFDTAEAYGPFANEILLGGVLKDCPRDKIVIASKFGMRFEGGRVVGTDSRPAHIIEVVEASLKRLQVDYLDLVYQHRVDPEVPIEDVMGAMAQLVQQGKVRFLGLSEAGENTIRRAHACHPISVLQSEYSMWERNLEPHIIPLLRELGIGLVPFSPLGRGFLTGTAKRAEDYPETDWRHNDPRFQGENFDANMRVFSAVSSLATSKGVSNSQIALAWLLHKGPDIVPIPGTTKPNHLVDNVAAANLSLSLSEMAQLDDALAPANIAGARYGERLMQLIDR
jgi:aryl-alcohol dehydrogenase-like predicted oxidoreductase